MAKFYTVDLKSHGNRDHGQTEPQSDAGRINVPTIEDAQKAVRVYIDSYNLGSGNFTGADVYDDSGRKVGYVSYNGRFWTETPQIPPQSQRSIDATRELLAAFNASQRALS